MNIEDALSSLRVPAPQTLVESVLDAVGTRYLTVDSEIGQLVVVFGDTGVKTVGMASELDSILDDFEARSGRRPTEGEMSPLMRRRLTRAIAEGRPGDLTVDLSTVTPFQREVLLKTAEIPAGQVRPYGWIAREIGRPGAVRAVGTALASNPVPVVIPCHRVVRSDGELGNYSLGETENKRVLLEAEGLDVSEYEALRQKGVRFNGSRTTKIFCDPTCRHARRTRSEYTVEFRNAEQATDAGYRPCKVCRPAAVAS